METERELFEIEARKYEDCDLSKNEDGSYKSDLTHACFYWWCASAQREGYKLVPVRCNNKMAHAAKAVDGRLSAFKYGDVWDAMIGAADE